MFRCQKCSKSSYRPNTVVTQRQMVNHLVNEAPRGPRGGSGSQIVHEIRVCDECVSSTPEAPIERAEPVEISKKDVAPGVTFNGVSLDERA